MKGTGTKDDMFIPESWGDFVTAIGTTDAYVNVPAGTVYDMSAIEPDGSSDSGVFQVLLNCKFLEMNGSSIIAGRNFQFYRTLSPSDETYSEIHNMNVEKFNNGNYYMFNKSDSYDIVEFYDCVFSGMGAWDFKFAPEDYDREVIMHRCGITVEKGGSPSYSTTTIPIIGGVNMYDGHIRVRYAASIDLHYTRHYGTLYDTFVELLGNVTEPSSAVNGLVTDYTDSGPYLISCPAIDRVYYKTTKGSSTGQNDNPYCTMAQAADPSFMYNLGFPLPYTEVTK